MALAAFGRYALRDYFPHLTAKERDEREEFVVEGCYLLVECQEWVDYCEVMRIYRTSLFSRIVLGFADGDVEGMALRDEEIAAGVDRRIMQES